MARVKYYLDGRYVKVDGTSPVKVMFSHRGTTAMMSTYIFVPKKNWDSVRNKVVGTYSGKNAINDYMQRKLVELSQLTIKFACVCRDAASLRDAVIAEQEGVNEEPVAHTFYDSLRSFAGRHANKRTRQLYEATWNMMKKYRADAELLTFEAINKKWLEEFFMWMERYSPSVNARNIHLRNIRAVFNDAIDNELTSCYPFRRFSIRPVATVKRSLRVDELRPLLTFNRGGWQQKYIDTFALAFYLVGINIGDLLDLTPQDYSGGRIRYNRKKTHRLYSIRVEPEAEEIIKKYKSDGGKRLISIADGCSDYKSVAWRVNECLGRYNKGVTTYWARHSWATIAAELEIPKETIAAALGHGGNTVTDIYIDFDMRKVDEANRRVIDYVLYDMK